MRTLSAAPTPTPPLPLTQSVVSMFWTGTRAATCGSDRCWRWLVCSGGVSKETEIIPFEPDHGNSCVGSSVTMPQLDNKVRSVSWHATSTCRCSRTRRERECLSKNVPAVAETLNCASRRSR